MPTLTLSPQEIGAQGATIYATKLRTILEPNYHGQFVAIDIESEDYEVAAEAAEASDRLRLRHSSALILVERIGYPAAFCVRLAGVR